MKVAITGASGLVGRALAPALALRNHEAVGARRSGDASLRWSTEGGFVPPDALSGYDAVVHLAGENVAGGRWTAARRKAIMDSRELGTRAVVEALRNASPRPRVLVSASAVGYYGDTGDRVVDESTPVGEGFLAEVVDVWEREAQAATELGVRVVCLRIGVVLARDGGALAKLGPIFRAGIGGRVGHGHQWMSWVHIDDVTGVTLRALEDETMHGPINVVAPTPVTNREFTHALGKALRRPTILPVPGFALRLGYGDMASVLLTGQRAAPEVLRQCAYDFAFPELDAALNDLLNPRG